MDPEDIHMVAVFKSAYVNFPSIEMAKKLLFNLRGKIDLDGTILDVDFYPSSLARNRHQPPKEVNLVQDWLCDKCEFKNFARRMKCHKCDNSRNSNCKIVYNSAAIVRQGHNSTAGSNFIDTGGSANASLMIRGNVLLYCAEASVLDAFNRIAPVKDIRMVKNKHTGGMRDFAFIEFYSTEEAEKVVTHAQDNEINVDGQPVQVAFSRSRRREDENEEEGGGGPARDTNAPQKSKGGFNTQQQQQQQQQQPDYSQGYYDPAVMNNLYGYAYANYAQMYQSAVPQAQMGQMDFNSNPFYNSMITNNLMQNTSLQAQASTNMGLKPASFDLSSIMPQMSTIMNQAVVNQATNANAQSSIGPSNMAGGNAMDVEKQQISKLPELKKLEEPKIVPIPKAKTEPPQTEHQKKLNEEKNKRKQIEIEMKKWEKEQQRMAMMPQTEQDIKKGDFNGKQSEEPNELKVEASHGSLESKPKLIVCFTCRAKFPSNEALALHERLSETHRRNIEKNGQKLKVI